MCYNCGCELPDDDMGHHDNITNHTFHHLAEKIDKSEDETKKMVMEAIINNQIEQNPNILEMFEKAAAAEGQTIEVAKKNTLILLKKELGE